MPDKPASERTEKPTPERLKKAREQGQVAQSQEIPSALMTTMMLLALVLTSGWLYQWFGSQLRVGLSVGSAGSMDIQAFAGLFRFKGMEVLTVLLPFLLTAMAASALGSVLVGGWAFAPSAVRLDFSRISPIKGLKSLFSLRSLVRLLVSITKLTVLLAIAWYYLSARLDTVLLTQWTTPQGILCTIARLVAGLVARVAAALMAIALVDMLYQRWHYKHQLQMTRQEVKEERKQHEVSPEVKGRVRSAQLMLARRRMLQEVPDADVVVTNPKHYAVALRYEADMSEAPQVVAKGADFLAEKIKEIAILHDVPIVEKPELARALYAAVDLGETIPETLFLAVAEVLAMIYRMRKNRRRGPSGRNK